MEKRNPYLLDDPYIPGRYRRPIVSEVQVWGFLLILLAAAEVALVCWVISHLNGTC